MAIWLSTILLSLVLLQPYFTTAHAGFSDYVSWDDQEGMRIVDIAWDGQQFIAAGSPNCVRDKNNYNKCTPIGWSRAAIVSPDGLNWKENPLTEEGERLVSIAYGSGKYVILARTWDGPPKNHIIYSDDGVKWQRHHPDTMNEGEVYERVIFVDSHFIALGQNGNAIASKNGRDWIKLETGTDERLVGVAALKGSIIIVGENGVLLSGKLGENLIKSTLPVLSNGKETTKYEVYDIASDDSSVVVIGYTGSASVFFQSSDGISWSHKVFSGFNRLFYSMTYGNGLFVGVGNDIVTSVDGKEWSFLNVNTKRGLGSVVANNNKFVAATIDNPLNTISFFTSSDGKNWLGGTVKRGTSSVFNIPAEKIRADIVGESAELKSEKRGDALAEFLMFFSLSGASVVVFVLLQIYTFFKLHGIVLKVIAAIPAILCSVVLSQTVFSYKAHDNLWWMSYTINMPILIVFLVVLLLANIFITNIIKR